MPRAKEKALAWSQDYCCHATSMIMEPDPLEEAKESDHAQQ